MRLIDGDRLKEISEINKANFNSVQGIMEWIDKQPTAYDVDKVIEQLHENGVCSGDIEHGVIRLKKAIPIVHSGGTSNGENLKGRNMAA